ncbi:MAG: response regulator [Anaerolineae bacterium]|nr:response regulator [Anaerolineae bacterium]
MNLSESPATWRVLIVDDEPDNLNLAADLLRFKGAAIAKANGANAGMALLDDFQPNLILLDLAMPLIDGWEMHKLLRSRPALDGVPIIALTAMAMPGDAGRVRDAGFDGYITKPFRVMALLNELTTCIRVFLQKKTAGIKRAVGE